MIQDRVIEIGGIRPTGGSREPPATIRRETVDTPAVPEQSTAPEVPRKEIGPPSHLA
jgi:hypothetical protein